MKTWMIISINQNGDRHFFYPKAKNMDDAFEMGKNECIRISDQWNTWNTFSAEVFDIKQHSRN